MHSAEFPTFCLIFASVLYGDFKLEHFTRQNLMAISLGQGQFTKHVLKCQERSKELQRERTATWEAGRVVVVPSRKGSHCRQPAWKAILHPQTPSPRIFAVTSFWCMEASLQVDFPTSCPLSHSWKLNGSLRETALQFRELEFCQAVDTFIYISQFTLLEPPSFFFFFSQS